METDTKTQDALHEASLTRGIIIGVLVLVLALILCGFYLWGSQIARETPIPFTPPTNNEPETPRADADIQILKTVSDSDEISAIEADLGSTNLDELDKELPLIERDLGQ